MSPLLSTSPRVLRIGLFWGLRIGVCLAAFVVTGVMAYRLEEKRAETAPRTTAKAMVRLPLATANRFAARRPAGDLAALASAVQDEIASTANVARGLARMELAADPPRSAPDTEGVGTSPRMMAEDLKVTAEEDSPSGTYRVSIAYESRDPEFSVRLANALAEQYADDCRDRIEEGLGRAADAARQAADRAREEFARVQTEYDAFLETSLRRPGIGADVGQQNGLKSGPAASQIPRLPEAESLSPSESPKAVLPQTVDNPDWTSKNRQLEGLRQRRAALLNERTPLHPEVRELDQWIERTEQELWAMPRKVPGQAPVRSPKPPTERPAPTRAVIEQPSGEAAVARGPGDPQRYAETVRMLEARKQNLQAAAGQVERLAAQERRASEAALRLPRIEVRLAERPAAPAAARPTRGWSVTALLAALAVAGGVGLIGHGIGIDPPLGSAAEVKANLPIPVVATIEAGASEPAEDGLRSWAADRSVWIVLGILVIAVSAIVVSRAGGWL